MLITALDYQYSRGCFRYTAGALMHLDFMIGQPAAPLIPWPLLPSPAERERGEGEIHAILPLAISNGERAGGEASHTGLV
jgi:hypothetical protein